jgi:hypothetical protein
MKHFAKIPSGRPQALGAEALHNAYRCGPTVDQIGSHLRDDRIVFIIHFGIVAGTFDSIGGAHLGHVMGATTTSVGARVNLPFCKI